MDNRCLYCGEIIPEGRQVCPTCEHLQTETVKAEKFDKTIQSWIFPVVLLIAVIVIWLLVIRG